MTDNDAYPCTICGHETVAGSLNSSGVCWHCERPADAADVLLQKLSVANWAMSHEYGPTSPVWTPELVQKLRGLVDGFEALAGELDAEAARVKDAKLTPEELATAF